MKNKHDQFAEIIIPLLNPNEPEALLAELFIEEKQWITAGEIICVLETTKSTAEIEAFRDGYIAGLQFKQGDIVGAGMVLCYLVDSLNVKPQMKPPLEKDASIHEQENFISDQLPIGLRITKPALKYAKENQVDLEKLAKDRLITIKDLVKSELRDSSIRRKFEKEKSMTESWNAQEGYPDNTMIVYGGGGHGKSLIELISAVRMYDILGVIDDNPNIDQQILGLPFLGGSDQLSLLREKGVRLATNAVGGIGDPKERINIFKKLMDEGYSFPVLIHPSAQVEKSARLYPGVQVFSQAYIGTEAIIHFGSIINTGAIISHECIIGEYSNISPGAILAGSVKIGDSVLIGMGVTINLGVKINDGAKIGNGATIKDDVPSNWIVRAGSRWPE